MEKELRNSKDKSDTFGKLLLQTKVTKNNAVNIALPIIILVLGTSFVVLSLTLPIGFVPYLPCFLPYHS